MTPGGHEALQEELKNLKTVERPAIVKAIAAAREHGDLSENAEYHAAREQQSFAEGRIQELEAKLSNVQVIDVKKLPNQGKIVFGATVTMHHIQDEKDITYRIVGADEANIKENKISQNEDDFKDQSIVSMGNLLQMDYKSATWELQKILIRQALKQSHYNQKKSAQILGLSYDQFRGVYKKMSLSGAIKPGAELFFE